MASSDVPASRGGAKPRPPSPPASQPRRARQRPVPKLLGAWKAEAAEGGQTNVYRLPLSALLLSGLTYDADEGPALDVLSGVIASAPTSLTL